MANAQLNTLGDTALHFKRVMKICNDLFRVHSESGGRGRGRRSKETSINGAIILHAMAGWQVVVEGIAQTAVASSIQFSTNIGLSGHASYTNMVLDQVSKFSTPNYENSAKLLRSAGFDPAIAWGGLTSTGPKRGNLSFQDQLNGWLRIRHAVAHGDAQLPSTPNVLQLIGVKSDGSPRETLILRNSESCCRFVCRAAQVTGNAFAKQNGHTGPDWSVEWPWS